MKAFLSILFLFISAAAINAQNLSLGAIAGIGSSDIKFEKNPYSNKSLPSYNVGLSFGYRLIPRLDVGVDLKYSAEGGKVEGWDANNNHLYEYRMNYVRIPLQAIYFFGRLGKPVQPKISLGPSFGFLTGGRNTHDVDGIRVSSGTSKDVFDGFDFGLMTSFGLKYVLGNGKWINTDVSYYYGLTDNNSPGPWSAKNRNFTFNIGMIFSLKQ